jgi:hypothetical protein
MIFAPWLAARIARRASGGSERARSLWFFAVLALVAAGRLGWGLLPNQSPEAAGAEPDGPPATRLAKANPTAIAIDIGRVFDFSTVTTSAQLAEHRAIAAKAQAANREMIENLRHVNIPAEAPSAMDDRAQKLRAGLQLGEADERLFAAILGQFDLLEDNWGHWHASGSRVTFNDPEVAKRYNAGLAAIRAIGAEVKADQAQLSPDKGPKN